MGLSIVNVRSEEVGEVVEVCVCCLNGRVGMLDKFKGKNEKYTFILA